MRLSISRTLALTAIAGATLAAGPVLAAQGDLIVRVGGSYAAPNDDSGAVVLNNAAVAGSGVGVESDVAPTFTVTYMLSDTLAIELLAALPFEHDVEAQGAALGGLGRIATVKHLPPTLSLQYHLPTGGMLKPYAGIGVNYTIFFEEEVSTSLQGAGFDSIELDNSLGLGLQAGVDFDLGNDWLINAELRYIKIDTEASLSGPGGTGSVDVDINPTVFTLAVGKRF